MTFCSQMSDKRCYSTLYRSEERCMFSAASVCLFVNTITAERVNRMVKLGGLGALYKNLGRVRIWGS